MRPDNNTQLGRVGTPQQAQRVRSYTQTPAPEDTAAKQREATVNLIRSELGRIFGDDEPAIPAAAAEPAPTPAPQQQPVAAPTPQAAPDQTPPSAPTQPQPAAQTQAAQESLNPYERTHAPSQPQADQWRKYHSAWQQYYQKYYEGYYTQQIQQRATSPAAAIATPQAFGGARSTDTWDDDSKKDEALYKLRQNLIGKVKESATQARKSRHFIPIIAAFSVVVIFLFLQYNQILMANVKAYITPGAIDPQNIIVDPTAEVEVGPEARLIIPKINVDTPVFYDIPTDSASQLAAMENGVAHFPIAGASAHPGEIGNTVLSGHSSNDVFAPGDYKFIFAQLEKVAVGDTIYANYNSKRYTYVVTKREVVLPSEVNKLVYQTDKPILTLITCTPLGTAQKRLLVTAEQISPDPSKATATSEETVAPTSAQNIPGQGEPTLIEKLFGRR